MTADQSADLAQKEAPAAVAPANRGEITSTPTKEHDMTKTIFPDTSEIEDVI